MWLMCRARARLAGWAQDCWRSPVRNSCRARNWYWRHWTSSISSGAALVFTAEGQLDSQTAYGKAVGAVATAAQKAGARVAALAGSVTADDVALAELGIDAALSIASGPMSLEESMAHTAQLLAERRRAPPVDRAGDGDIQVASGKVAGVPASRHSCRG